MLRVGQEARVGRSETVEMCLPSDALLAEEHFAVGCEALAWVESLRSENCLLVDGVPKKRIELTSVQEETIDFVAGGTSFTLHRIPDSTLTAAKQIAPLQASDTEETPRDESSQISEIVQCMCLSPNAAACCVSPDQSHSFVGRLIEAKLYQDAIRFLGCALPPRIAVGWAIESGCPDLNCDKPLAEAIQRWIESGKETNRQAVQHALVHVDAAKPHQWLAQAVLYSGGSLGSADQPVVTPPPHLSAIALVTAIRWSLTQYNEQIDHMVKLVARGRFLLTDDRNQKTETKDAPCCARE